MCLVFYKFSVTNSLFSYWTVACFAASSGANLSNQDIDLSGDKLSTLKEISDRNNKKGEENFSLFLSFKKKCQDKRELHLLAIT